MTLSETLRRRLRRPLFLWPVLALVLDLAVQRSSVRSPWLTMLPVIPMLLFVVALIQAIRHMDELQQRISVVSMSVAFVLSVFLTLTFIGLQRAGVYEPHWDDIGTYMLALWACAYAVLAWRYR